MNIRQAIANLLTKSQDGDGRYSLFNSVQDINFDRRYAQDFLRYNDISLYANKAIDKRAEKVGEVQFVLKKGETILERHPLLDLLNRPNQFHTGSKFWKLYQKYYDITGTAFIFVERNRKPFKEVQATALHLIRPDLIKIKFNKEGTEIEAFTYHKPSGGTQDFDPEDIIYAFNPDPMSPINGASLLKAGVRALETEIQIAEYHAKILKNGGKVESVFSFTAPDLTKMQIEEMKERYKEQYAGAKQAGMPLFLGGGAKYERVGLNPDELSYLEAKGVTLDDICILTGVPKAVLSNFTDIKFDNADAAHTMFLRETIKPLLKDLTTTLDWRLVPEGLDLDFIDPTPEDIDRKMKVLQTAHDTSTLTLNERREMLGHEPLPLKEADQIFIPFSLTPLEGAADPKPEPEDPKDEPEEKGFKGFQHPLRDEFVRKRYGELMVKRMDRQEGRFLKATESYFAEQRNRLIEPLNTVKTYRRKGLFDEVFDISLEVKLAQEKFLPLLQDMLKEAGDDAMEFVEAGREFVLSSEIRTWLDERSHLLAGQLTDTTFEKLKSQFTESLEAGENRQQLIKRIEDTYEGFANSRARTIARTEVHGSVQKGTFEGYKQSNLPIKIWVTVGDAHVRDSHASIDGEEKPIHMAFSNGLMYPGDPLAPASETVNCRCTV